MSTTPADPYGVLGVPPTATPQELGRAYRRLLRSHHPDTRPGDRTSSDRGGDGVSLADVLAAYELLRDPVARAEHDRARRRAPAAPAAAPRRTPVVRTEPPGQRGTGHAEPQVRVGAGRSEPQIRVGPVLWRPSR